LSRRIVVAFFIILLIIPIVNNSNAISFVSKNTLTKTVYYCDYSIYIEKRYRGASTHMHGGSQSSWLYIDSDLDEFRLNVVMNYSIEMNYSRVFSRCVYLPPIGIFGLKIDNNSEYSWKVIKMPSLGKHIQAGNITVTYDVNTTDIESGDHIDIKPWYVSIIDYEFLDDNEYTSPYENNPMLWKFLIRFTLSIPFIGQNFLLNNIIPFLEPYNRRPIPIDGSRTFIRLIFV